MKKLTALVMAISIASTSMLAGCSSAKSSDVNNLNTAKPTKPTADNPLGLTDNGKLDWYLNVSWLSQKWGKDWITAQIKKDTGLDVNIIVPPAGGEAEKLSSMVASGELPDVITMDWGDPIGKSLIGAKMVAPLNKLADTYSPDFYKVADPDVLTWNKQEDGNVYSYNGYNSGKSALSNPNIYSNYSFLVRKDIYEAIGKPDMSTPEGFTKALQAAKAKFPSINGKPLLTLGSKPFLQGTSYGSESFFGELQDFLAVPYEKDGKLYDRASDPEYLNWLKVFRADSASGLIPNTMYSDTDEMIKENIKEGRYFAMITKPIDYPSELQTVYAADPNKAYIAINPPKNSKGDKPTLGVGTPNGWLTSYISAKSKHQENAIKFMTYMMQPKTVEMLEAGIEGKTFTKDANGTYKRTPEYQAMIEKNVDDAANTTGVKSWAFFVNAVQDVSYFNDDLQSTKIARGWSKPYLVYTGAYEFTPFTANSKEAIADSNINILWSKTLPAMMLSKSDADFDKLFTDFISKRDSLGYKDLVAAKQAQLTKNLQKVANFKN